MEVLTLGVAYGMKEHTIADFFTSEGANILLEVSRMPTVKIMLDFDWKWSVFPPRQYRGFDTAEQLHQQHAYPNPNCLPACPSNTDPDTCKWIP